MSRQPHLSILPVVLIVAALIAGYLAFSTGRYLIQNYQLRGEERALRNEIADLDRQRVQLEAVRLYLDSDEYVEQIARRVLGLVRPGETLVIVNSTVPSPEPSPEPLGTPGARWWEALFYAPEPAPEATPAP